MCFPNSCQAGFEPWTSALSLGVAHSRALPHELLKLALVLNTLTKNGNKIICWFDLRKIAQTLNTRIPPLFVLTLLWFQSNICFFNEPTQTNKFMLSIGTWFAMIQPAWQIIAECEIQKEDPWDYVNDGALQWFEKWLSIVNVINDFAAHSLSWFDVFLICLMCFVMLCSTNALVLYIIKRDWKKSMLLLLSWQGVQNLNRQWTNNTFCQWENSI